MATHTPKIEYDLPTWVFIQRATSGNYRHEIRRVHRGYMIFINASEATDGGRSTCTVFPTYREAHEVLSRLRPTAELVTLIASVGMPESLSL